MAASEIRFPRAAFVQESRDEAIKLLDQVLHQVGLPLLVRYLSGSQILALTAIGVENGTGRDAYRIMSFGAAEVEIVWGHGIEWPDANKTRAGQTYLYHDVVKDEWQKVIGIESSSTAGTSLILLVSSPIDVTSYHIYVDVVDNTILTSRGDGKINNLMDKLGLIDWSNIEGDITQNIAITQYLQTLLGDYISLDTLEEYAKKTDLPTKVSLLENDLKYISEYSIGEIISSTISSQLNHTLDVGSLYLYITIGDEKYVLPGVKKAITPKAPRIYISDYDYQSNEAIFKLETTTEGADIYYIVDYLYVPTIESSIKGNTGRLKIKSTTTTYNIKGFAEINGVLSSITEKEFTLLPRVNEPIVTKVGDATTETRKVIISNNTEGTTTLWSTDNINYKEYLEPINISSNQTIYAYSTKDGMANSAIVVLNINDKVLAPISIEVSNNEWDEERNVSVIYNNLNYSSSNLININNTSWNLYTSNFNITQSTSVLAKSTRSGYIDSDILSLNIQVKKLLQPIYTIDGDLYSEIRNIKITRNTNGPGDEIILYSFDNESYNLIATSGESIPISADIVGKTGKTTIKLYIRVVKDGWITNTLSEKIIDLNFIKYYYGQSLDTPDDIRTLPYQTTERVNTFEITLYKTRLCYCYPSSEPDLTSIRDIISGIEYKDDFSQTKVIVLGNEYKVYTLHDIVTGSYKFNMT